MRILSGIQPSGALHLGNYFGMMQPAIALQEKGEAFYFIADYHSMTSLFAADERRKNSWDVALDFLACGLDPKKSVFFRQSDVPEVCELSWLLSTLTPMSTLEKAHSFKDIGVSVESSHASSQTSGTSDWRKKTDFFGSRPHARKSSATSREFFRRSFASNSEVIE